MRDVLPILALHALLSPTVACRPGTGDGPAHPRGGSALWGDEGEDWSATGRLPDFAHAGIQAWRTHR